MNVEALVIWLLAFVFAYAGARLGVRHEVAKLKGNRHGSI